MTAETPPRLLPDARHGSSIVCDLAGICRVCQIELKFELTPVILESVQPKSTIALVEAAQKMARSAFRVGRHFDDETKLTHLDVERPDQRAVDT